MLNPIIRKLHNTEYSLLGDFLYSAIFIPPGATRPPRDIIRLPELAIYIKDFGEKPGDFAQGAEVDGQIVGLCWCREITGLGHWQKGIPSLAISVNNPYRGQGIGRRLLEALKAVLKEAGYKGVSLSVQKDNSAVRLYRRAGFKVVTENKEDYVMFCSFEREKKS